LLDAAESSATVVWHDGSRRILPPAATLARARPHHTAAGITRVAMLTGLDRVGIPVAAAYRPNSRSIAVHQGKGRTPDAARASAVMEAVEMWHAENPVLPLRLAAPDELAAEAAIADPSRLPRAHSAAPIRRRLLWTLGTDLADDRPVFVPYELVAADFTRDGLPGGGLFQATTNGLASGNHPLEAILHGLFEVIERDAVALWEAMPPPARAARLLAPATIDDANADLLARFAAAGIAVGIWDVTTDIGIAAFLCLGLAPDAPGDSGPEMGAGCHADRAIALSRALTELAQVRLTRISGARDDFSPESWNGANAASRSAEARAWLATPGRRDYAAVPTAQGATLHADLAHARARLREAGMSQVIVVDLARPAVGIPVVRVIVPGLEGPWTPPGGEYVPGPRAAAAA
jgi:ribosomal protein S12 methylthiotransferase accessory factor